VQNRVLSSLASSQSLLNEGKRAGVALCDIGAGVIDLIILY